MTLTDKITISRTPSGAIIVKAHYRIYKMMQAKTADLKRKVVFQIGYDEKTKSETFKVEQEYIIMLENILRREEERNKSILEGQISIFDTMPF